MNNNLYINYGCGLFGPLKWKNFDASPTLRFERWPIIGKLYTKNDERFQNNIEFGDIVRGLPIPNGSCKGVYCSHILEHLALDDFRISIENTYKILQNNGIFRFVMPDLQYCVEKYFNDKSEDASLTFLKETALGRETRRRGVKGFIVDWLGNSNHLWMWDLKSTIVELKNIGFVKIRRASYGDSDDMRFLEVENESRWTNCLGIECQKP